MKKFTAIILLMLGWAGILSAQTPKKPTSADIHADIKKLNVLASVLYVAAHPDDENTRLIAYLANEKKANTAYLSMTRGDGGQNLIGTEIRELLGVLRTQELLAARRVDGGKQFFTRANDFGFSKNPDETFTIWDRQQVLSDVVFTIRQFQPDVVINRFDLSPGRTHGHHTASAMLSFEAFDLAADAKQFPEQLTQVEVWQPKRLFFNTSWWFYGSREKFEAASKEGMVSVDVGVFYPMKGKSNTEIAAESRSMHKCQGFGSAGSRGSELEYLQFLKGEPVEKDIFEGINTTWTRVEGGAAIGALVTQIDQNFRHENPAASLSDLLKARKMIQNLPKGYWRTVKLQEVETIIKNCLGLFAEAVANDYSATRGDSVQVKLEAVNRSAAKVFLKSVTYLPAGTKAEINQALMNNRTYLNAEEVEIPTTLGYSFPFWLRETATLGMYSVSRPDWVNLPETPRDFRVQFEFLIENEPFFVEVPIMFKETDPVKGEVYRPFEITPPVFVRILDDVYVFADEQPKTVRVLIKTGKANFGGMVGLQHSAAFRSEPSEIPFYLKQKGEELTVEFKVFPNKKQGREEVKATVRVESGEIFDQERIVIDYDHIPVQTIFSPAKAALVRVDLVKKGEKIGYLMGAGDEVPASLEQIGYQVKLLQDADLTTENLAQFDAVLLGVRAFNTVERLRFRHAALMEYVKNGGTLIVQYNTTGELVTDEIAPYPLELSRDRVTVENAEVRILKPEHPVLNSPNKITATDFEGWVQERGLYFPNKWDEAFEAILSCNDPNESPKDGGLLVARYGKGFYVYTGYSWFRQLPAGVAGAFRIFTNLISLKSME